MRLLLDTQIFLWAAMDSPQLDDRARGMIVAADEVYVSAASVWEVAIKHALGRIDAAAAQIAEAIGPSGFIELPITARHAAAVENLPLYHRDPFDRLLLAQAMTEPLHLLSADSLLPQYSPLVIPVHRGQ